MMKPGEILSKPGDIVLNATLDSVEIDVANTGDRPVQVGSHYHFAEANESLSFDREKSKGRRLDIPAGTAVRFEPGQSKKVSLVTFQGEKKIFGFNGKIMGNL